MCIAHPLRQWGMIALCSGKWLPLQIGCPQISSACTYTTQFISIATRQQLAKLNLDALSAEFPTMHLSSVVRDLGIFLDSEFTIGPDIDQVCRSCYCQSKQLRVIARSLTEFCCFPLSCV